MARDPEKPSSENSEDKADPLSPLASDLKLIRILDRTIRSRFPDGVSLLRTLEGGLVLELHRRIRHPFSPHACARAAELTEYLWQTGKAVTLEPGGGITIRNPKTKEKVVLGRAFFKDAEVEYRMLHKMIADALGTERQGR